MECTSLLDQEGMKKLKKKKLEERKPELSSRSRHSSEAARMREATRKRRLFFERASRAAEAAYAKDPLDAENLTRWGGALLELAHCQDGPDSVEFVEGAISKLAEALKVERRKHDTLWCMGNAYTSLAFYTSDIEVANTYFAKATWCFEQACEEEPQNESYSRSFKFSLRTPELHPGLRTQMASEQASQGTSFTSSATASKKNENKKDNSDLKYDILGWVILVAGIVAWGVGMTKYNVPYPSSGYRE